MPNVPDVGLLLGAERIHHSGTTLAHHLVDTWKILVSWECPEATCLAGLLHSTYGVLAAPNESTRQALGSVVGIDAERIMHAFYLAPLEPLHLAAARAEWPLSIPTIEGSTIEIDQELAAALVAIDVAGSLEQRLRIETDPALVDRERVLFASSIDLLPPPARDVVREVWG